MTDARRPRILIGTFDSGGLIPDFAEGFRRLGHEVTTVVSRYPRFHPGISYDIDISPTAPDPVPWPECIAKSHSLLVRIPRGSVNRLLLGARLLRLVARHDVFFFQCGGSTLTNHPWEFPILKGLGKTIVSAFMGGDAREWAAYRQEFGPLAAAPELEYDMRRRTEHDPWNQLRTVRQAELYSDAIFSQPNQAGLALRPYHHLFIPVQLERYRFAIPGRERPMVVHAPSGRAAKGTRAILAALERLRSDGVAFDLRLLENLPNAEVRAALADADVVVDQLYFPYHGKLGVEAMASGCALATANRQDIEPYPQDRPIWPVDADCLYPQLKSLLSDRALRIQLAERGRTYVEQYHDPVEVARRILACLDSAARVPHEHYPTFYAQAYKPPAPIPHRLRTLSMRVARRWGLPPGIEEADLIDRGVAAPITPPKWERLARRFPLAMSYPD